jgi:hypothetical protein
MIERFETYAPEGAKLATLEGVAGNYNQQFKLRSMFGLTGVFDAVVNMGKATMSLGGTYVEATKIVGLYAISSGTCLQHA